MAHPIQKVCDYVKHLCREHHQEADCRVNLGSGGVLEFIVEGFSFTTAWKTIRGHWGGSEEQMAAVAVAS